MIQITADTRRAVVTNKELLTVGSAGIQVEFTLSEDWNALSKLAVFRVGDDGTKVDVVLGESLTCVVPPEVLTQEDEVLFIGIYGSNGQGTVIIPTVWASAGVVKPGTEPETPASAEPTPEIWAQILGVAQDAEQTATEAMSAVEAGLQDLSALENSVESAEAQRVANEQGRVTAEQQRTANENIRASAETDRSSAEDARAEAEQSRVSAETGRVSAETGRVSAEAARVSAESARVTAEQGRVAAEENRESHYAEYVTTVQGYANAASASATSAAGSATDAASSASSASTSAGQAASSASSASTSASQASNSASSASTSATTASNAATAAITKAGEAAASATAAGNAQTAAETAQTAAEEAAESIEESAAQIAQNTQDISDVKNAIGEFKYSQTKKARIMTVTPSLSVGDTFYFKPLVWSGEEFNQISVQGILNGEYTTLARAYALNQEVYFTADKDYTSFLVSANTQSVPVIDTTFEFILCNISKLDNLSGYVMNNWREGYQFRGYLPENANVNNVTLAGWYILAKPRISGTTGLPTDVSIDSILYVYPGNLTVQVLQELGSPHNYYQRYLYNNNTQQSLWIKRSFNSRVRNIYLFGDSLTKGVLGNGGTGKSYLEVAANIKGYTVVNCGVGGIGYVYSAKKLVSEVPWNTGEGRIRAQDVINHYAGELTNADTVVLAYGVNDWQTLGDPDVTIAESDRRATSTNITANVKTAIETIISAHAGVRILVVTPVNTSYRGGNVASEYALQTSLDNNGDGLEAMTLEKVFLAIVDACNYYGVEYIDMTHNNAAVNYLNINSVLPDKLHPSQTTYYRLAESLLNYAGSKADIAQLETALTQQENAIDAKQDATSYVTLSGTIVTQTGADNTMYLCGELAELTFNTPAVGQTAIRFRSGTTPTVASFPNVTEWMGRFDPDNLEASALYEINVLYGVGVAQWT